jgi:hypothetical protein
VITVITVLLVGGALVLSLPRGLSTDLTRIGQGKPALVMIHDHNFVESLNLMQSVNAVRGDYDGALVFLVADPNTPQGRGFMEAQGMDAVALVLFDAGGRRIAHHYGAMSPAAVEAWLNRNLALAGP